MSLINGKSILLFPQCSFRQQNHISFSTSYHPHNLPIMSSRGGRGGARGGGNQGGERKKRESILNLAQFVDKSIRVKFMGGREATGILKGYDQLMNLVMDDVVEEYEDGRPTRSLGLVVLRGPNIVLVSPTDGSSEIENPFQQ